MKSQDIKYLVTFFILLISIGIFGNEYNIYKFYGMELILWSFMI